MSTARRFRMVLALLLLLLALAPWHGSPGRAEAAGLSFTVNTTADAPDALPGDGVCADAAGQCSLRAAVQEADAAPYVSAITITVPAGSYVLMLGPLTVTANLVVLDGAGSATTFISAAGNSAVLDISIPAGMEINRATITGGNALGGGGIDNQGSLVLSRSSVSGNVAGAHGGGGIFNNGSLKLVGSSVANNTGGFFGGGIYNTGTLVLSRSSVVSNTASGVGNGGGIYNFGTVIVSDSSVVSNTATYGGGGTLAVVASAIVSNTANGGPGSGYGGGLYNDVATAIVVKSAISNNTGAYAGGAIYNDGGGSVAVTTSAISHNTAGSYGGGIVNNTSTFTLINSTINGNAASHFNGGGVDNFGGTMTITSSTIVSNSASSDYGGALYNSSSDVADAGAVTVTNSTIVSNTAVAPGGGISNFGGAVTLLGTVDAGNTANANCNGPVTSIGYNLDSGTACGFSQTTDLTNTNPLLGPLQNNGGPTPTLALLPGSPAIDHGETAALGCPARDQRGLPRPDETSDNGACDIGAYESQGSG